MQTSTDRKKCLVFTQQFPNRILNFGSLWSGSLATSVCDHSVFLAGASGGIYALITAHLATITLNWHEDMVILQHRFRNKKKTTAAKFHGTMGNYFFRLRWHWFRLITFFYHLNSGPSILSNEFDPSKVRNMWKIFPLVPSKNIQTETT